jgi:all-trans-retinol 13,14-reductase
VNTIYSANTHRELSLISWDAIIIGSGLGGLTTAVLMAKSGKKVLVLERHYNPGGFTHTFTRKGFEWDVGVHYVGQVANPKAILRKVFDYVTDGKLQWQPMDAIYDRVVIAGDTYDFVRGIENQIASFAAKFPGEEAAIRKYYRRVKSTAGAGPWFFGEKTMPGWLSWCFGWLLRRKFERAARLTTYDVIRSFTRNEKLISVLSAQCGDYGLTPKRSSFAIHAVVVEHYVEGGSYPIGGAASIPRSLVSVIRKNGGTVLTQAEVTEILLREGRAVGVRMKDGAAWFAPAVISNAGARNTFQHLLNPSLPELGKVNLGLSRVAASTAHVCLYVGVKGSDAELNLPKHNVWVYDRYDFDKAYEETLRDPERTLALTYLSFPSAKDPAWPEKHPGQAAIQVISALPYDHVKRWQNLPWGKRGDEYQKLKLRITEKLLERLYQTVPQIRGRVVHYELSTPLSTRHFAHYSEGEIYGLEHTPARFQQRFLRPQTPIKGLFLTGQDIVTVGVGGALFSGVLTATKVLHKSMMFKILRGS